MRKIAIILLFLLAVSRVASAREIDMETDAILNSAEGLFKAMKSGDYAGVWTRLTQESKDTIVKDVLKELVKSDNAPPIGQLHRDFELGSSIIVRSYWDAYVDNFNPSTVLDNSKWEMGEVKGNKAEIILKYKKSENPAHLRMFKEAGLWKVGLVETFWNRK